MQINGIVLDRHYLQWKDEYDSAYRRVMESGWYILGKNGEAFEKQFADYLGARYCIGVNSGLDALSLAVRALGIGSGDEVLVPANTYIATVLAVTGSGATPVFIEPDDYFNIDSEGIQSAVTKKTKAILCVHLFGQVCRMDRIEAIAKKYGLFLIEDCAQAHGAAFEHKMAGTWGDIGCFSFYPTKNLGAFGDAGAIVTKHAWVAERVRCVRNYGSNKKYHYQYEGVNSRMDELQAAMLSVKLNHLNEINQERQQIGKRYQEEITNSSIQKPKTAPGCDHIYHQYVILTQKRDKLQEYLAQKGILTQIHYPIPPHLAECYRWMGYERGDFPKTEYAADHMLSLPVYTGMTDEEQRYVIAALNQYEEGRL